MTAERFASGSKVPPSARPVTVSERAQLLRRARYALTPEGGYKLDDRVAIFAACDGAGRITHAQAGTYLHRAEPIAHWWPHVRDSSQEALRELRFTLALVGVPEKLPRNAAAPRRA